MTTTGTIPITSATLAPAVTPSRRSSQRWVLAVSSLASLMVALDALIVSTALGTIRGELHASAAQLGWTVDAYTLSFAVLLMPAAVLGDRLGRRRLFIAGLILFTVASAACALAPSIGSLIAARAVQGAGAAIVMPLALALLGAAFEPEHRARALGVYSAVTGLSTVAGPLIGGVVTQGLAWQWIFWLNVPLGAATALAARTRIRESHGPGQALDGPGLALLTGAALGLVGGLVRSSMAGWNSAETITTLTAGAVLALAFVAQQRRSHQPLMPPRLFASRAFAAGNAAMFFLNATLFGALFLMAQFQQVALGQDPVHAGLRLLPWGAAMFCVASRSGTLATRFSPRTLIAAGLTLQAVGMAWLAIVATATPGYPYQIAPMICAGAGFAAAIPVIQTTVLDAVTPQDMGKASGTLSTIRQLGGALGLAITLTVFTAAGNYASTQSFTDGFTAAISTCAALSLIGALTALILPRGTTHAAPRTPAPATNTDTDKAARAS